MSSDWLPFRRFLGGALTIALFASCASVPRASATELRAGTREVNYSPVAGSEALTNLQPLVGGRTDKDCAMAILALSLGMLGGAIAIAATAGASAPVIGLALAGVYSPATILAC